MSDTTHHFLISLHLLKYEFLCLLQLTLFYFVFLLLTPASLSQHMNDFIKVVKQVEDQDPTLESVSVLKTLRSVGGLNDAYIQHFLGETDSVVPEIDAELSLYIKKALQHRVTDHATEEGIVLTPDGTTVALMPLLLGIEAGLLSKARGPVQGLYQLTLAKDLDLSPHLTSSLMPLLGPDGCWDNVSSPQVFTLSASPFLLTTAQINGGIDGVLLGMEAKSRHPQKISILLTKYYCHQLDSRGMDAAPRLISQRRRENFRGLVSPEVLTRQLVKSLELKRKLTGHSKMDEKKKRQMTAMLKQAVKEFVHKYMGESKKIIIDYPFAYFFF